MVLRGAPDKISEDKNKLVRILLSAGGTAGHVLPALTVLDALKTLLAQSALAPSAETAPEPASGLPPKTEAASLREWSRAKASSGASPEILKALFVAVGLR